MPVWADLKMFARFAGGLRAFLRQPIDEKQARDWIDRLVAEREQNFLRVARRGIYGYPRSPYLPMLRAADCSFRDLELSVQRRGLEQTLRSLREAGVYVSFEESKGRVPLVRDGQLISEGPVAFANPFLEPDYASATGGSSGTPTRVEHELGHLAVLAAHELVTYAAHDAVELPTIVFRGVLPDGSGFHNTLRRAHYGQPPQMWCSPVDPWDFSPGQRRFRFATWGTLLLARLYGVPLPWPHFVPVERADTVARAARRLLDEHGRCLVLASASRGLRVCLAAEQLGFNLQGAVFRVAGEPLSDARLEGMQRVGARVFSTYGFTELGRVGMGCRAPLDQTDVHLCQSLCALIQYPRNTDLETIDAWCFTSVLPTAPRILLNTESDDTGLIEERSCGCPLDIPGLGLHLRRIRSFRKLTTDGATLFAADVERLLEHDLPARFGGTPFDYQLAEQEDGAGLTRLHLRVHPRLTIDGPALIEGFYLALARQSVMAASAANLWRQGQTLRIVRVAPRWTGRGKFQSLVRGP